MNNPENFGEAGYGYNDDGTEMNRDDYYAENPQAPTDEYEQKIREAEQEEEGEYLKMEAAHDAELRKKQSEAIAKVRALLRDIDARLDAIMAELEEHAVETPEPEAKDSGDVPSASQQDLGNKAMGAASVPQGNLEDKSGAQPVKTTYVDRKGVVHSTLEDYLDAEAGYK